MTPTAFDEENAVLEPPPGMAEGKDCSSLSVFRNGKMVISCWKPTAEELAEINKTGRVCLLIMGQTMPPALPMGTTPFTKEPK